MVHIFGCDVAVVTDFGVSGEGTGRMRGVGDGSGEGTGVESGSGEGMGRMRGVGFGMSEDLQHVQHFWGGGFFY